MQRRRKTYTLEEIREVKERLRKVEENSARGQPKSNPGPSPVSSGVGSGRLTQLELPGFSLAEFLQGADLATVKRALPTLIHYGNREAATVYRARMGIDSDLEWVNHLTAYFRDRDQNLA